MKRLPIALACLALSFCAGIPALSQAADEPASKDDIILYLRTMRSHEMFQRIMEVQSQNMQQLFRDRPTIVATGFTTPARGDHYGSGT